MHTDALFYRLFQERPATVFELAGLPFPSDAGYQLTAVEVKQTAFRLDGILMPSTEQTDAPVLFVETQFQPEPNFYARWLASIHLHLYRHNVTCAWRAIGVFPDRATEPPLHPAHQHLIDAALLHRVYLEDLLDTTPQTLGLRLAKLVVLDDAQAAAEARELATATIDAPQRIDILDLIETILIYKFPRLSRAEIKDMLHLPNTDLKQTRFYQEVFAEGRQEGRQEGREEGREEGAQQAETRLLLRLISRRFGPPAPDLPQRIAALTSLERGELSEALLDFGNATDVGNWLENLAAKR
jgi:predicted transposase/invertase (TIGR01784 family)